MPRSKLQQLHLSQKKQEAKLNSAIEGYASGTYKTLREAAEALGISAQYTTLTRRFRKVASHPRDAHESQQLLSSTQEAVLVNWGRWLGFTGHPLCKETISPKVEGLCGKKPSPKWIRRFLVRHAEEFRGRRAVGLDTQRAQAFNFEKVNRYFDDLQAVFTKKGQEIPWRNLYNFDEIGLQLCGMRKGDNRVFFFAAEDRSRYKLKSGKLELVTILETVCGDGTAPIKPCFVFAGSTGCEEWFEEDDIM